MISKKSISRLPPFWYLHLISPYWYKKSPWTKIYWLENCLNTSVFAYYNIFAYLHSPVDFFAFFIKSCGGFFWGELSICVFTNIIDNSVPLNDRELRLLVSLLSIILKMRSSATLQCGIVIITSAIWTKRSNWKEFVPGIIMPFRKLQSSSTGQCPTVNTICPYLWYSKEGMFQQSI